MLDTGMRIGELTGLIMSRLDLDEKAILLTDTKTGQDRVVYFASETAADVATWLESREAWEICSPYLFVSNYGEGWKRLTNSALRYRLHAWQRKAGVPSFRVHDLRHTAAISLLHNGMPLDQISLFLGHTTIVTTAIYLRSPSPDLRDQHQRYSPRMNL